MKYANIFLDRLTILTKMAIKEKNIKEAHKIIATQLNFFLELRKAEPQDPMKWTEEEMLKFLRHSEEGLAQVSKT